MNALWQDLKYAIRVLKKSPAFTAIAILTLALGIGANTAIFSVVNAVLLRPLGFKDPGRIVQISGLDEQRGIAGGSFGYPCFVFVSERATSSIENFAVVAADTFNLVGAGEPVQIQAARVSSSFFDAIGVQPEIGRGFLPGEDKQGAAPVAVLGYSLWRDRFGSDPKIVGRSISLNGLSYTIVGVIAHTLDVPFDGADIWIARPYEFSLFPPERIPTGVGYLTGYARLKPGVTLAQTRAELETIEHAYQKAFPSNTDATAFGTLEPVLLTDSAVGGVRGTLWVLLGAVGFVLLIACANVANLLLVRATGRSKEIAVRAAIGATRFRLAQQFLTESILLALIGGGLGVLVAAWGVQFLSRMQDLPLPRTAAIGVDARVLIFSLGLTLLTGILFGLAPTWRTSRVNLIEALKETARGSSSSPRRNRAGAALVIAELALSVVLLAGAGLLLKSFVRLLHVNLGFAPENVLTFRISLPTTKYPQLFQKTEFFREVRERIAAVPSVESVATTFQLPPNSGVFAPYLVDNMPPDLPRGQRPVAVWNSISPAYFQTLGIPLLRGRAFTDADGENSADVIIISESMAKNYWPHEDPVGHHIQVARQKAPSEIVGVVADVRNQGVGADPMNELYTPLPQRPWATMAVVVKTAGDPMQIISAVRSVVAAVDREQPITQIQTLDSNLSDSVAQQRLSAFLLGIFAAVALILATVGIYGVTSYTVAQRTQEIGIRIALGAQARDVLLLVLGFGARLAIMGVVAGIAAAIALTRLMQSLLFHVSPTDPYTLVIVSGTLACVALLACYVPARRATRVDPVEALRSE
jgi:putative ABC transport system permease protein